MKYKSVDEIETLSFRDATLIRCIYSEKQGILEFEFDGAVVRENNSANELYTDRYASDMQVRFTEPEIEALLLVLQESVPDKPVDRADYENVLKSFEGKVVFYSGQPKEMLKSSENADRKCYQMIIDVDEESYVLSFYYDKVIAQWEHFMNKVMN